MQVLLIITLNLCLFTLTSKICQFHNIEKIFYAKFVFYGSLLFCAYKCIHIISFRRITVISNVTTYVYNSKVFPSTFQRMSLERNWYTWLMIWLMTFDHRTYVFTKGRYFEILAMLEYENGNKMAKLLSEP